MFQQPPQKPKQSYLETFAEQKEKHLDAELVQAGETDPTELREQQLVEQSDRDLDVVSIGL